MTIPEQSTSDDDIATLVATLNGIQQRIRDLTGGKIDAVLQESGKPNLLPEAQEHLRRSEATQRRHAAERGSILDALPACIALLDSEGRVVAINETWRRIADPNFLVDPDLAVGENYIRVCESARGECGEQGKEVAAGVRSVIAGSATQFAFEYACHSTVRRHWYRMIVTPLKTAGRSGAVVMHLDITDRKLAEVLLAEREERLQAIFESEPECVTVVSLEGVLLDVNPAGLTAFEAGDKINVVGRAASVFVDPEDISSFDALHKRVASGKSEQLSFRVVGLKGTVRWMETHSAPLRRGNGTIESVLSVMRDVTDRRNAESRAAAAEEISRHSQRIEAIGQLTGGIAHDFNNILAIIMLNVENLLEDLPNPAAQAQLTLVLAASERGADLVSRLLTFARQRHLDAAEASIGALLDEFAVLLRVALSSRIPLILDLASDLRCVLIDRTGLESAILNLTVNARDAMPNGGELHISARNRLITAEESTARPELQEGQWIEVSVRDTGVGMSPQVQKRVFEPFYSTKEQGKGTGLGLSMVNGFVHQSGGFLTLSSEIGKGTTFSLFLPAVTSRLMWSRPKIHGSGQF